MNRESEKAMFAKLYLRSLKNPNQRDRLRFDVSIELPLLELEEEKKIAVKNGKWAKL